MERLFRIPFAFLFVAACVGMLLRWYVLYPMAWLIYPNWLHTHSHTMFLGWVGNFLMLAYLYNYSLWKYKRYRVLFYCIQGLLVGMLISFPMQGYGVVSILLSTLHTVAWWFFTFWYFADLKKIEPSTSIWYSKISLLLFTIASFGPFSLGALMANGLGHSNWYYFSLYYYLHFQYNGFFIFGVLHLWFHLVESKTITFNIAQAKTCGWLLLISLFPMYLLSVVWAKPGVTYNAIGFMGGLMQVAALIYFFVLVKSMQFSRTTFLWKIVILCFTLKTVLQLLSAHPTIAQLALEVRPFVISYLHLVVIGVVSFSFIAWSLEKSILNNYSSLAVLLLLTGFASSEIAIILSGVSFSIDTTLATSISSFISSLILTAGLAFLLFQNQRKLA